MKFLVCFVAVLTVTRTVFGGIPYSSSTEEMTGSSPQEVTKQQFASGSVGAVFMNKYQSNKPGMKHEDDNFPESAKKFGEEVCPGHGDTFGNATVQAIEYFKSITPPETICSMVKKHFTVAMQAPVGVLEKCMPAISKDIPSMVVKMIVAVTSKMCMYDGEHIMEFSNPCVMVMNPNTKVCLIDAFHAKALQYGKKTPSAKEVCEFITSLKSCVKSHVEVSCGNKITIESFMGVFDAVQSSCDSVDSTNVIEDTGNYVNGTDDIVVVSEHNMIGDVE